MGGGIFEEGGIRFFRGGAVDLGGGEFLFFGGGGGRCS